MVEKNSLKKIAFFALMMIFASVFILLYLAHFGNINEVFTDVVDEFTALDGSNKSAERALVYILAFSGIVITSVYYFIANSRPDNVATTDVTPYKYLFTILGVFACTFLLVYKERSIMIIAAIVIAVILYVKDKEFVVLGVSLYFMVIYGICGIYRLYVYIGGEKSANLTAIIVASLSLTLVLAFLPNGKMQMLRGTLIAQLIIPFTLLMFLMDRYYYAAEDTFYTITIPKKIRLVIFFLITAFIVEAVYLVIKKWNTAGTLQDVLSYGACVAIMAFNRYIGTGSILPSDIHHPYENITAYFQIVEHGARPFVDYIPASGFYSFVQGWFFAFFGHGIASYYFVTENLMYLFFVCIIVFLLKKQLKAQWVLFVSLVFLYVDFMDDYNRIVLILPHILLLTWPALIDKKNLWLKAWFLSSFLHGLYYPVYGAAVAFAFAPLGLWQIYTYAKSGQLKSDIKTAKFWAWWALCFAPVFASAKILIGLVKHMGAMSGQTNYADGISRFGQSTPVEFLDFIPSLPVKLSIYYIITFLIPVSLVWLSVALFHKNGVIKIEDKKLSIKRPEAGFVSVSFAIMLLIAFTFTTVRFDIHDIYARSWGVIAAAMVMVVIIIARYMTNDKSNALLILAFSVFTVALVSKTGFYRINSDSKLEAYYTASSDWVHAEDDKIKRYGEAFVHPDLYEFLSNWYDWFQGCDQDGAYLGGVFDYGPYFLFDVKGAAVMETPGTLKGYTAVQESVDMVRANGSYVGAYINPVDNYYLYHWLVTSGDYKWDAEKKYFIPNDGSNTVEEIQDNNKGIALTSDGATLKRTAGSWGSSMDSLESIFKEVNIGYQELDEDYMNTITFEKEFDGDEADFMYIEFAGVSDNYDYILFDHGQDYVQEADKYPIAKNLMKKDYNRGKEVYVYWTADDGVDHLMRAYLDEGKLLMPLGAGQGWLLNRHSSIKITMAENDEFVSVPDIKEIRLLKLREIQ
ncbi:MAG: hypothetical protein IKP29_02530 [Pseudobutyrivibrio sp.]|nr:hypothetical protein [Pseudobutyrivibrio sp.]